ncbi:hypothetical protein Elgi_04560 [Paenibacillus elgii]|nr:hypothetical protein Elgi_04560 [Paenibacillus elgii]
MNLYTYVKNNPLTYADPTGHNALRLWMTEQALQGAGAGATVKPFPGSPPIPPTYVIDQPFMTPSEPTVYEQPFIGPPAPTVTQQPFIGPEYPVVNQQPIIEQEANIYYSEGAGTSGSGAVNLDVKPQANSPKLQNFINSLYRGQGNPS